MVRILVADDDANIRGLVCTILKNNGFEVFEAVDGRQALVKMPEAKPDLCVIDVLMPNVDGFGLCAKLRQYYGDIPILMLTALDDIAQKVKGYELGADDYLTKPFEPAELTVRVKALLRRSGVSGSEKLRVGAVTIDRGSHTVCLEGGKPGDIPLKEFEILYKLAKSQGKIIARDDFIEDIWGIDFEGNERTLDVHINRLRERFPTEKSGFKITAIRGIGYRLETMPETLS